MITEQDVIGIQMASEEMVRRLNNMSEEEARAQATNVLIQTGVLNSDGSPKQQIVNGSFFGW